MTFTPIAGLPGGRKLMKAIASGELSTQELRSLPAQHLYMAIQALGLEAIVDVLPEITPEQYRLLLDFELWHRDVFQAEHLFEWLSSVDEDGSLEPLEQFLRSADRELLALLMARYVKSTVSEEPTELPPGPGWYTPDKGYTWILIEIDDPHRHYLFGKLLAYLFQRHSELFYQLAMSIGAATPLELEEECYQLQRRRLSDEGIPDHESSWQIHAPLAESAAARAIASAEMKLGAVVELERREPAVVEGGLQPLGRFLQEAADAETVSAETAALLNAAVVFFGLDFSNKSEVEQIAAQIQGAINIGLERVQQIRPAPAAAVYEALRLRGLYQLGLSVLFQLRAAARYAAGGGHSAADTGFERACELAAEAFPLCPAFLGGGADAAGWHALDDSSRDEHGRRAAGVPFTSLAEVARVADYLRRNAN